MANDRTPEQIAAGLSEAQRKALLWLPADGRDRRWFPSPQSGSREDHRELRAILLAYARVDRRDSVMRRNLTPLGRAVRAAVLAMQEARDA